MRKIIFTILLFISSISLFSQYIDSLRRALIINTHDTERVFTLLRLSNAYSDFDRDTAMQYAQEGLNLAQQNDFKKGEAQGLNMIGSILEGTGNYPKAFEYRLESLRIAEEINNQRLIASIFNNLARVSTERSDYKKALEYLFKAKLLFEEQGNREYLSDALLNIGDNYERMHILDSALYFQKQSYELALESNYSDNLGTILTNLGSINSKLGDFDTALQYFRMAVQLLSQTNQFDKEALAGTFFEMSKYFEKKENFDSSLFYAKQSFSLSMQVNDRKKILNAAKQISHIYDTRKKVDSAYKYNKIADEIREKILSVSEGAELERMAIAEKARQAEKVREEAKVQKERKNNLRLISIALFIITFFAILIIVSRRKIQPKAIKYLGLLGLLLMFEFIALFIHPYIDKWTNHHPVYMLLILVAVAAILVPFHHKLEHWVKEKLVGHHKQHLSVQHQEQTIEPTPQLAEKESPQIEKPPLKSQ